MSWWVMNGSTKVCHSLRVHLVPLWAAPGHTRGLPPTTLHLGAGSDRSAGPLEWTFGESTLEQATPKSKA